MSNVIPFRPSSCVPAHKQTDPGKAPGQWVNQPQPANDADMAVYGAIAANYKPTHGGYPDVPKDKA